MHELLMSREANFGALEFTPEGRRWRGIPFVLETHLPALAFSRGFEAEISDEVVSEPSILTIECKDADTGRTVYFNDPGNPLAYR